MGEEGVWVGVVRRYEYVRFHFRKRHLPPQDDGEMVYNVPST